MSRSSHFSEILLDNSKLMPARFQALFALKQIDDKTSYDTIIKCMTETAVNQSALLEHELAYVLGQMNAVKDHELKQPEKEKSENYEKSRIALEKVLQDESRNSVVRHEAGESLAAMLSYKSLDILKTHRDKVDNPQEVRETCDLACERFAWIDSKEKGVKSTAPFASCDPSPPFDDTDMKLSCGMLIDADQSIWKRYRAMFTIRNELCSHNVTDKKDIQLIVDSFAHALHCSSSALFRHEIGYVLGQVLTSDVLNSEQVEQLRASLEKSVVNEDEHGMVRHESAMALGELDTDGSKNLLQKWSKINNCPLLSESCDVALNMVEDDLAWTTEKFEVE